MIKKKLHTKQILDGIAYYEHGENNAEKIIVLHGHRSDSQRILPISRLLSEDYHVYTPDLPGSGDSETLVGTHTIDSIAKKTASWINNLAIENYSLCGISMGGMVSIRMLKYLQHKPSTLYLYGTPLHVNELTPSRAQKFIIALLKNVGFAPKIATKIATKVIGSNRIMSFLFKLWYPHMSTKTRNYEISIWRSQQPCTIVESIHDFIHHSLLNEKIMNVKTVYMYAKHDNVFDTKLVKEHVNKILPNTKFVQLNLNSHVPKGKLSPKVFAPFLQVIKQMS